MKKFFSVITTLILVVILSLDAAGCNFVGQSSKGNGNLPNSQTLAESIVLNSDESVTVSDKKLALDDAVEKVERTSVAIYTDSGSGSGVIVDMKKSENESDKYVYVITCHHVIDDFGTEAGKITVAVPDEDCKYNNNDYIFTGTIGNRTYDTAVTLVGGDKDSDIAVLRINLNKAAESGKKLSADKIVKAKIQEDYNVRKGENIFAIGNPTGLLPGTVSDGIVSYLERETSIDDIGDMTLLQISVTINPGNSGGGLYNLKGELIGITNAGNTSYEAINYAIPAYLSTGNGFLNVATQLLATQTDDNYGYVTGRRQKLGLTIAQGYTEDTAGDYTYYVYVQSVTSGGIAASKGLQANDKITSVSANGGTVQVTEISDFSEMMNDLEIGDTLRISYSRKIGNMWSSKVENGYVDITITQYHFCDTGLYPQTAENS